MLKEEASASTTAKQTPYRRLVQSFQYEWPNTFQEPKGPQSVWSKLSAFYRVEITRMFSAGDSPSEMEVPCSNKSDRSRFALLSWRPGQGAWSQLYLEAIKGNVCSMIKLNYPFCFMEPYTQQVPIQQLPVAKSKDKQRKKKNGTSFISSLVVTVSGNKWQRFPVGLGRAWKTNVCSSLSSFCRTSGSRNRTASAHLPHLPKMKQAGSGSSNFREGTHPLNHIGTVPEAAKSWRSSGEDTGETYTSFEKASRHSTGICVCFLSKQAFSLNILTAVQSSEQCKWALGHLNLTIMSVYRTLLNLIIFRAYLAVFITVF